MFGARKTKDEALSPYATRADFCQIFQSNMNSLYLLAFLLTADQTLAEQCFVGGLHISQEGNHVFREWAERWARRAIILNAIRMVRPHQTANHSQTASGRTAWPDLTKQPEMARVMELPTFERFVFVMSVLEGFSELECSLHLGCMRSEVVEARSRALKRIGQSAQVGSMASTQQEEHSTKVSGIFRCSPPRGLTKPITPLVAVSS